MARLSTKGLGRIILVLAVGAGALVLAVTSRAEQQAADLILVNGIIHTMEPDTPRVEAVAIRDGAFIALGTSEDIQKLAGKATQTIDLAGRMAMPGLIDGHSHPTDGAIGNLFSCKFEFTATPADIARVLSECVKNNPESEWIIGGRWDSNFFENHDIGSPRAWLDRYSGGKAVYFSDDSGHNGWANTKALSLVGITADTRDPAGGKIMRDPETGVPNGLLLEEAQILMESRLPDWTDAQYRAGVREMVRIANSYGLTGLKDANAREPILKAYHAVDQAGGLSVHLAASISTPYGHRETPLDYARIEALRDQYASTYVDTRFVKIFDDGVPTASRTAAMLDPYLPHDHFPADFRGLLHVDEAVLAQDLAELEKRDFTVKIHTAGDRSVRVALNAIEQAHKVTGRSDLRHELAHAGYIDPADIPRFKELNAVADLSPYLWHPSPIIQSVLDAVGERGEKYWPIRDLLDAGAPVLAGADWPAAVPSLNPWIGIEAMVTRRDPYGKTPGALWPEQAITLEEALRIFTIDGARALRRDAITGSVRIGKSADLIVLDRDLFSINPEDLAETTVEMTIFAGRPVQQK